MVKNGQEKIKPFSYLQWYDHLSRKLTESSSAYESNSKKKSFNKSDNKDKVP